MDALNRDGARTIQRPLLAGEPLSTSPGPQGADPIFGSPARAHLTKTSAIPREIAFVQGQQEAAYDEDGPGWWNAPTEVLPSGA